MSPAPEVQSGAGSAVSSGSALELRALRRDFGEHLAVDDVSLAIGQGEFVTLLGPSGCGKTTILRMVAGFEQPDAGEILIGGKPMRGVPSYRRPIGIVFQNLALFPHMTVEGNIAFGLEVARLPRDEVRTRVADALVTIGLPGLGGRRVHQISGGQRQRVALARALVTRPTVLLLDEPLGALDLKIRRQMQIELKRIQRQVGTTFVFVTHDQEEALTMSDRIAVMNHGRIEQLGTPAEIYDAPRSAFVARFVGDTNLLAGRVVGVTGAEVEVRLDRSDATVGARGGGDVRPGDDVVIAVRPENLRLAPATSADLGIPGSVTDLVYAGAHLRAVVASTSGELTANLPSSPSRAAGIEVGSAVRITWNPADGVLQARDPHEGARVA